MKSKRFLIPTVLAFLILAILALFFLFVMPFYQQSENTRSVAYDRDENFPLNHILGSVAHIELLRDDLAAHHRPIEEYLYDLDFLQETFNNNYPFLGVAYRLLEVDINERIEYTRYAIENSESMNDLLFAEILFENVFYPLDSMAHTHFRHASRVTGRNIYDPNYFDESDVTRPSTLWNLEASSFSSSILKENEIAYIRLERFNFFPQNDMENYIRDFISMLDGYQHLIVDMREVGGGIEMGFVNSIIRPFLTETFNDTGFAFFTNGEHARFVAERNMAEGLNRGAYTFLSYEGDNRSRAIQMQLPNTAQDDILEIEHTPAVDIVERYNLIHMNSDDLVNLAYGYPLRTRIPPIMPHLRPNFDGQIWLLTSPRNASAGEIAAMLAKDTGVAILVGETTGGAFGAGATSQIALPNTPWLVRWDTIYITDRYGRAFEEYRTTPHFENRPGLDALETVLELIEEGAYREF